MHGRKMRKIKHSVNKGNKTKWVNVKELKIYQMGSGPGK